LVFMLKLLPHPTFHRLGDDLWLYDTGGETRTGAGEGVRANLPAQHTMGEGRAGESTEGGVPAERLFYGQMVTSIDGRPALAFGNTLAMVLGFDRWAHFQT
jgi:hypothetical protein